MPELMGTFALEEQRLRFQDVGRRCFSGAAAAICRVSGVQGAANRVWGYLLALMGNQVGMSRSSRIRLSI